jgi:hypothetical protein
MGWTAVQTSSTARTINVTEADNPRLRQGMNQDSTMPASEPPLIVGMSTLPSRIGKIRPAIDSLLQNTRRPDKIVLTIPRRPLRGDAHLTIPGFLEEGAYRDHIVLNLIEEDFGPGSKLMGCLGHIAVPSVVILADDDMEYREFLIERLYARQIADHAKSFSFYTYRHGGMSIGQGADGFSIWSENLRGIEEFYGSVVRGDRVAFHDDLWISYFLLMRGVQVESLRRRLGDGLVYESVHTDLSLKDLKGELARERLTAEGLRQLRKHAPLPLVTSLKLAIRELGDQLVKGAAKLKNRIAPRQETLGSDADIPCSN